MSGTTFILPGQLAFGREGDDLKTILGSCVAVVLYDREQKLGGMNHYLLTDAPPDVAPTPRYGAVAMRKLFDGVCAMGTSPERLVAKIYGGGNVIDSLKKDKDSIGARNISLAREQLKSFGIKIVEEDVGGDRSRRIHFNCTTGEVTSQLGEDKSGSHAEKLPVNLSGFSSIGLKQSVSVLIVDDSATVRTIFQRIFEKAGIKVLGTAADAFQARALIVKEKPDVITLDIEMPQMSGVKFLEKLMKHFPVPTVMVSSLDSQGEAAVRSLEIGAIEFVHKPSQFDPNVLKTLGESLVEKVKAAANQTVVKRVRQEAPVSSKSSVKYSSSEEGVVTRPKALLIGGNTGSQNQLEELLEKLPHDTPPIFVANTTLNSISKPYSEKLDSQFSHLKVIVPSNGHIAQDGEVYIPPTDHHIHAVIEGGRVKVVLSAERLSVGQFPSSDYLFRESSRSLQASAIGICLGGFGSDGVKGAEVLSGSGASVLCVSPDDCQFPFLPQNLISAGVVTQVLSVTDIVGQVMDIRSKSVA